LAEAAARLIFRTNPDVTFVLNEDGYYMFDSYEFRAIVEKYHKEELEILTPREKLITRFENKIKEEITTT